MLGCAALLAGAIPGTVSSVAATPTGRQRASTLVRAPATKPQIVGLIDKGSEAPYHLGIPFPVTDPSVELGSRGVAFAGIVVNESWAQLEPRESHFTFGPLDRSLGAVTAYNRSHRSHPLMVKLRLWGGFRAPGWAKMIAGRPVTFDLPRAHGSTGEWWKAAYRQAWSGFQHALAARYDANQLVGSVAVSSCATLTAEPFVMSPNQVLLSQLLADGWSSAAQQQCLDGALADYAGWKRTSIDYTFNTFPAITPGSRNYHPDPAVTDEVMSRCANLQIGSGRTCILSNHALSAAAASAGSRGAPVYAEIDTLYERRHGDAPVDFQTFSPNTFGDCAAINVAVTHHAQSVELWPASAVLRGYTAYPVPTLGAWARALRDRRPLAC